MSEQITLDLIVEAPTVTQRPAEWAPGDPPERWTALAGPAEWFTGGPATFAKRVEAGLHPTGRRLAMWPGATCGRCRHAVTVETHGIGYWKCAIDRATWTRGPGSDVRLRWRACASWLPGARRRYDVVADAVGEPVGALDLPARLARLADAHGPIQALGRVSDGALAGLWVDAPSDEAALVAGARFLDALAAGVAPGRAGELLLKAVRRAMGEPS